MNVREGAVEALVSAIQVMTHEEMDHSYRSNSRGEMQIQSLARGRKNDVQANHGEPLPRRIGAISITLMW
jgi:hypothetical protein